MPIQQSWFFKGESEIDGISGYDSSLEDWQKWSANWGRESSSQNQRFAAGKAYRGIDRWPIRLRYDPKFLIGRMQMAVW